MDDRQAIERCDDACVWFWRVNAAVCVRVCVFKCVSVGGVMFKCTLRTPTLPTILVIIIVVVVIACVGRAHC